MDLEGDAGVLSDSVSQKLGPGWSEGMSQGSNAKAVEDAYLEDLALQRRRDRELGDRQELLLDRLENLITGLEAAGVFLVQAQSKAAIEKYLNRKADRRIMTVPNGRKAGWKKT